MKNDNPKLQAARIEIDKLDYQIENLLNQRATIALEIAKIKLQQGLSTHEFYQPKREIEILQLIEKVNSGPLSAKSLKKIFQIIMNECLSLQQNLPEAKTPDKKQIQIGIQGIAGSFSEVACQQFIQKNELQDPSIQYLIDSENVLNQVENNQVDYGIIAIDNSLGGIVTESILALAHHRCQVVEIFGILVKQNLLALPKVKPEEIKTIHSHQQALRQCTKYLATHFPHCAQIAENDTAESARRLSIGELPTSAAVIGNINCAKLYGLNVLASDIQDSENNVTLFLGVKPFGN